MALLLAAGVRSLLKADSKSWGRHITVVSTTGPGGPEQTASRSRVLLLVRPSGGAASGAPVFILLLSIIAFRSNTADILLAFNLYQ